MVNWASVVEVLISEIAEALDDELSSEQITSLKKTWLERLFQRGKINMILDKFKVSFIVTSYFLFRKQSTRKFWLFLDRSFWRKISRIQKFKKTKHVQKKTC